MRHGTHVGKCWQAGDARCYNHLVVIVHREEEPMAAAKIRSDPKSLRDEISPRVKKTTRADLTTVLTEAEKETANKAIEFVEKIASATEWRLDDWVELVALAGRGRYFNEVRLAFTEISEVEAVAFDGEKE